jgi:hypothetical protein
MPIIDAIRYLVLERISRDDSAINALIDYINGMSPVEIATKYGMSKDVVRGIWTRVLEKCGSHQKAMALVRHVIPLLMSITPIVKQNENAIECTVCGAIFVKHRHVNMAVTNHVKTTHWDYVEKATEYIVSKLKEMVLNSNKKQI